MNSIFLIVNTLEQFGQRKHLGIREMNAELIEVFELAL